MNDSEHAPLRPHVKIRDWSTSPSLDRTQVGSRLAAIRERVGQGLGAEQALAMLREVEQELVDGKLTRDHDNAMQILAEIRAAEAAISTESQRFPDRVMVPKDRLPCAHCVRATVLYRFGF